MINNPDKVLRLHSSLPVRPHLIQENILPKIIYLFVSLLTFALLLLSAGYGGGGVKRKHDLVYLTQSIQLETESDGSFYLST